MSESAMDAALDAAMDGDAGERLTSSTRRLLALRSPLHASWSPDGSLLTLTTTSIAVGTEDETIDFTLLDVATGAEQPVPGAVSGDRLGVWAPDGARLAVLADHDATTVIAVIATSAAPATPAAPAERRVLHGATHVVGVPVWSPDGTTIAVACRRGIEIDRTRPYRWTRPIATFDGLGPLEDPPQVRLVDVATGEGRWVTDDGWRWSTPRWSPDGRHVAAVVSLDPTGRQAGQFLRVVSADGVVSAPPVPGGRTLVPTWLPDGRLVVLIGEPRDRPSGSTARLVVIDGDEVRPVSIDADVRLLGDVYGDNPAELADSYDTVLLAVGGSSVVVRTGSRGRMGIARVDVDTGAVELLATGDRCCSPVAARDDLLVLTTQSCERPVELAVVTPTPAGVQERRLTSFGAGWDGAVEVRRFVVIGPDGPDESDGSDGSDEAHRWPLDAWFLVPVGSGDRALPTVLAVHGGPQFAYGESFNIDVHALCAAGFGVLFTDPRGSTGWGDEFAHAVHSDWADGPTRDVLAVIDHAVASGWADGERLGVTGNSYGGYLSAWLSATTGRFRAAVIENPVTDLVSMWGTSDIGLGFFAAQFGGPPRERMDVYVAQSPIHHAHRSTTPTLFVVGEMDRRCPPAQAWAMHRVLVSVGTPSEVLVLPGSSHEGSTYGPPMGRLAHDHALVEWMSRWLGPG